MRAGVRGGAWHHGCRHKPGAQTTASSAGSLDKHEGVSGLDVCGARVVRCGSACASQRAMATPLPLKPTAAAPPLLSSRPRVALSAKCDYSEM